MRFRAQTNPRQGRSSASTAELAARVQTEASLTRFEPQTLSARRLSADPYAAWLAHRESERRADPTAAVRWVYRYPRPADAVGEDRNGGTREASASTEDGLVGVA